MIYNLAKQSAEFNWKGTFVIKSQLTRKDLFIKTNQ